MDSAMFALPSGYPLLGYGAGWAFHEQIDQIRRWQGKVLDALGFGPIETPSVTVQPSCISSNRIYLRSP